MPELPEVETIVRELNRTITGKNLRRFLVFDKAKIKTPKISLPQKIKSVARHGKYIVCDTRGGLRCLIHLRMTGELLLRGSNVNSQMSSVKSKHDRAVFHFSDGLVLRFHDVRRFGTLEWLTPKNNLPRIGPDPLSKDFTPEYLSKVLQKSSLVSPKPRRGGRAIKSLLLDQKIVSGIGNIYADEALWAAKIHPKRKSSSLGQKEAEKLAAAIKKVLHEGIKKGGFTLRDYRRIDGSSGYYQNSRKAYDREGQKCLRCSAKIRRMKVGGRSSYFCHKCQK